MRSKEQSRWLRSKWVRTPAGNKPTSWKKDAGGTSSFLKKNNLFYKMEYNTFRVVFHRNPRISSCFDSNAWRRTAARGGVSAIRTRFALCARRWLARYNGKNSIDHFSQLKLLEAFKRLRNRMKQIASRQLTGWIRLLHSCRSKSRPSYLYSNGSL